MSRDEDELTDGQALALTVGCGVLPILMGAGVFIVGVGVFYKLVKWPYS